jgi:hypothetical protein
VLLEIVKKYEQVEKLDSQQQAKYPVRIPGKFQCDLKYQQYYAIDSVTTYSW